MDVVKSIQMILFFLIVQCVCVSYSLDYDDSYSYNSYTDYTDQTADIITSAYNGLATWVIIVIVVVCLIVVGIIVCIVVCCVCCAKSASRRPVPGVIVQQQAAGPMVVTASSTQQTGQQIDMGIVNTGYADPSFPAPQNGSAPNLQKY